MSRTKKSSNHYRGCAKIRAAGYIRVSSLEQVEQGYSLAVQERKVRDYIETQGWELVGIFIEPGVSGRRDDRQELAKLMARLAAIDVLVVPSLSRLGRSNRHLQNIFGDLADADVRLVSLSEGIDTTSASGKLLRNMLAALSEFEADLLSERVRGSGEARAQKGRYSGGSPPYGYAYSEQRDNGRMGGLLIADPVEAPIVRRIFREYLEGRSQKAIAAALDAAGIPTRKKGKWHQGTVRGFLSSPVYLGKVRHQGEVYDGEHEALVSAEDWNEAQRIRERMANEGARRWAAADRQLPVHSREPSLPVRSRDGAPLGRWDLPMFDPDPAWPERLRPGAGKAGGD